MASVDEVKDRVSEAKDRLEEAVGTLQLKDSIINGLVPKAVEREAENSALREMVGLYKAQLAFMKHKMSSKQSEKIQPIFPVVDLQLEAKNLPDAHKSSSSLRFRVCQDSRDNPFESSLVGGAPNPQWPRCQFSATQINFVQPITFEVVDASTGFADVIGFCKLNTLDLLKMGGDYEVPLNAPSRSPIMRKVGENKTPTLIFHHFAVSGNANRRREKKDGKRGNDNSNEIDKKGSGGLFAEDTDTKKDAPEQEKPSTAARVPTNLLPLEKQVEREEQEIRERRRKRIADMRAIFGCKQFELFEHVIIKSNNGKGQVVSKVISSGPNEGKHRVRLASGQQRFYLPEELEAAE